jgi:hypothetical protein
VEGRGAAEPQGIEDPGGVVTTDDENVDRSLTHQAAHGRPVRVGRLELLPVHHGVTADEARLVGPRVVVDLVEHQEHLARRIDRQDREPGEWVGGSERRGSTEPRLFLDRDLSERPGQLDAQALVPSEGRRIDADGQEPRSLAPGSGGLIMREQSAQHQGALPRARLALQEDQRVPLAVFRQLLDRLVAADQVLRIVGGDDEPLRAQQDRPAAQRGDEGQHRQGSQEPRRQPFRCGRELVGLGDRASDHFYEVGCGRKTGTRPGNEAGICFPVRREALQTRRHTTSRQGRRGS